MLKNQLDHLQSESLTIPEPQRSRLRWCGSRASGKNILHISQTPGILSIINEDTQLDMVNLISTYDGGGMVDQPSVNCTSTFWSVNLSGNIPFPTNYFDALIIEDTLAETLAEQRNEVQRLVKPNGKIIVTEKRERALHLKEEWEAIFLSNELIDHRVDDHYVSVVLRNVINIPDDSEHMLSNVLNEMEAVNDRLNKEYAKAVHQKLEAKKNEELARLQEKNKLVKNLPFVKRKHDALIEQIELSSEEKKEILQKPQDIAIHIKKCDLENQLSRFQALGNVTVVFGKGSFYRKNSLVFSHQLVDVLCHIGRNVVYVHEDVTPSITPLYRTGETIIQMSTLEFWNHSDLFVTPDLYISLQDLQLAKRIGRFQWKKWRIYYLPNEIADQEVHNFTVNSLYPHSLISRNASYLSFVTEKVQSKDMVSSYKGERIIAGYVGDLGPDNVDYQAIKEMLVANKTVSIELIGYNLPEKAPINTKRLSLREYTNDDDVRKRVGKWTFGILPLQKHGFLVPVHTMTAFQVPILYTENWNAPIQEQKIISLHKEKSLSELLEEAIYALEGGEQ
ncbi:class I SAM-dependent methyltransferase [Bacillus sp. RAR_GA_16]|uniref:class I SAM-dependent methyltransferase n=1 Tax=Bacillus sp. RAR_GA_16 TaxID=2876774 RepID=UPI001CCC37B5|nr:class I SAM-dependent methyltransferase [Bacillus sp. RAR_GA_16]MCA0172792.1 class I SAM-dependent methyltransferase [Bacillus sp. RAR_GA_16]